MMRAIHANRPVKLQASVESSLMEEQGVAGYEGSELLRRQLDSLANGSQSPRAFQLCSTIAEALYREARRLVDTGCGDLETARLIEGRTAIALITAEQAVGHHSRVVRLLPEITASLSTVANADNLVSLQVKRLESLIEVKQFDQAEREIKTLQQVVLPPLLQLSLQVLTVRLRACKANGREVPLRQAGTTLTNRSLLRQIFAQLIRSAAMLASLRGRVDNGLAD